MKNKINAASSAFSILLILVGATGCKNEENNRNNKLNTNMEQIKGYTANIEQATAENKNFRKVLYTSKHMQLVLMTLKPNEEIGEEVHPEIDQFFRFESGNGVCTINTTAYKIKAGDVVIVPAGARHNVINSDSTQVLTMYTIYSPPNHKDGVIRATKKEAEEIGEKYDGKTTE